MKTALKKLVKKYLTELANTGDASEENIDYMSDKFVEDVERILSARKDFKED